MVIGFISGEKPWEGGGTQQSYQPGRRPPQVLHIFNNLHQCTAMHHPLPYSTPVPTLLQPACLTLCPRLAGRDDGPDGEIPLEQQSFLHSKCKQVTIPSHFLLKANCNVRFHNFSDASSMSTFNLAAPDPAPSSSEESVSNVFLQVWSDSSYISKDRKERKVQFKRWENGAERSVEKKETKYPSEWIRVVQMD